MPMELSLSMLTDPTMRYYLGWEGDQQEDEPWGTPWVGVKTKVW